MTPSIARPTSLPHENLPALPELAPVPEWSPPYPSSAAPAPAWLLRLSAGRAVSKP